MRKKTQMNKELKGGKETMQNTNIEKEINSILPHPDESPVVISEINALNTKDLATVKQINFIRRLLTSRAFNIHLRWKVLMALNHMTKITASELISSLKMVAGLSGNGKKSNAGRLPKCWACGYAYKEKGLVKKDLKRIIVNGKYLKYICSNCRDEHYVDKFSDQI